MRKGRVVDLVPSPEEKIKEGSDQDKLFILYNLRSIFLSILALNRPFWGQN